MPIRPRKTRSCSTPPSSPRFVRVHPAVASERRPRESAEPRRPDLRSSCRISARRSAVRVRVSSPTSSCEQRASSTSGAPLVKTRRRSCLLGIRVNGTHQLALGGKWHFADAYKSGVERFARQPGFTCRDDQRAFGRIALHRPASVLLLQHGVVGTVGDGECAQQLERSAPSIAPPPSRRISPSGA